MKNLLVILSLILPLSLFAQTSVKGKITAEGAPLEFASVLLIKTSWNTTTDSLGNYSLNNIAKGEYHIKISHAGFKSQQRKITVTNSAETVLNFDLKADNALDEIVVTGTLKAVNRLESPVPVEVYKPTFFKKNPTANIFEALQNVNGVRPQLNCNVCNTGDIHINGLEGPYTLVLIDGMPIVSGLSTVYGLSGIPNSLLERVEVVKGPASSLYGSEAVGGLINIITKNPKNDPVF